MNAHTKQQQDKVLETDFIDSQKSDPLFAHFWHCHICNIYFKKIDNIFHLDVHYLCMLVQRF